MDADVRATNAMLELCRRVDDGVQPRVVVAIQHPRDGTNARQSLGNPRAVGVHVTTGTARYHGGKGERDLKPHVGKGGGMEELARVRTSCVWPVYDKLGREAKVCVDLL